MNRVKSSEFVSLICPNICTNLKILKVAYYAISVFCLDKKISEWSQDEKNSITEMQATPTNEIPRESTNELEEEAETSIVEEVTGACETQVNI